MNNPEEEREASESQGEGGGGDRRRLISRPAVCGRLVQPGCIVQFGRTCDHTVGALRSA